MPRLTPERLMELVYRVADGTIGIDMVYDDLDPQEALDLAALVRYEQQSRRIEARRRKQGGPQRRARRLLATLIAPDQAAMLRRRRYFTERGASGAVYEFSPNTGTCRLRLREDRGRKALAVFCYHDDREGDLVLPELDHVEVHSMPPADVTIGQLLMIRADEDRFLREANASLLVRLPTWRGEILADWREAV